MRRPHSAPASATVFSRLFSYLLIALLLTNIALLGAMYLSSQRLIVAQAHTANISLLRSEAEAYRQSLASDCRVAVMLFQNENVKALMTQANFSYSAAASFLQNVVGCVLLVIANAVIRKLDEDSSLM